MTPESWFSPTMVERPYAGQQDNSTIAVPSLPPALSAPGGAEAWWRSIGGCETGPAVPKPGDPGVVYANCKGRFGLYNARTGQEQQYYVGAVNLYGHNPADLPDVPDGIWVTLTWSVEVS